MVRRPNTASAGGKIKLFVSIALLAVGSAFAEDFSAESKEVITKIAELNKQETALLDSLTAEQSDAVEQTLLANVDKAITGLEAETAPETKIARVKRGAGKKQSRAVRARRARRIRNLRRHRNNIRLRNVRRQRNLRKHQQNVRLRNARRQRNIRNQAAAQRRARAAAARRAAAHRRG